MTLAAGLRENSIPSRFVCDGLGLGRNAFGPGTSGRRGCIRFGSFESERITVFFEIAQPFVQHLAGGAGETFDAPTFGETPNPSDRRLVVNHQSDGLHHVSPMSLLCRI